MLCGYAKQTCSNISVQELIDILSTCKNKDAKVKVFDTNSFFIHFDQEGQFINLDKKPYANNYGNKDNGCSACSRYNPNTKSCECTGNDCLNAESIVDTKKFSKLRSHNSASSTDSISGASMTVKSNDKYDLSKFGINGTTLNPTETVTLEKKVNTKEKEVKADNVNIQDAIDNAIIKTLTKMINGIKGDNK